MSERIEALKLVDFHLFFACIRLYLNCYQAVIWLKDELFDFIWTTEHGTFKLSYLIIINNFNIFPFY
jgi:hypothetical protein